MNDGRLIAHRSSLITHHSSLHWSSLLQRDELLVLLMAPLPLEEIVVAAAGLVGVLMTDAGARVVDRAAPRLRVDEHADRAVDLVLLVPQDLLAFHDLGEAASRSLHVDVEMLREPAQVFVLDDDAVVA